MHTNTGVDAVLLLVAHKPRDFARCLLTERAWAAAARRCSCDRLHRVEASKCGCPRITRRGQGIAQDCDRLGADIGIRHTCNYVDLEIFVVDGGACVAWIAQKGYVCVCHVRTSKNEDKSHCVQARRDEL